MLYKFFLPVYVVGFMFTYGHAYTNYLGSEWIKGGLGPVEISAAVYAFMPSLLWPLYWSTHVF